jgi:hypothetical protein
MPGEMRAEEQPVPWFPETVREWVMWAGARLYNEGIVDPSPSRLYEEIERRGPEVFPGRVLPHRSQMRRAKHGVLHEFRRPGSTIQETRSWEQVAREVALLLAPNRLIDEKSQLLRACQRRFVTAEAIEFSANIERDCFCGNLLWLEPYQTTWQFGIHDVETVFSPRSFPAMRLGGAEEAELRNQIAARLDPSLKSEIDHFLPEKRAESRDDPEVLGIGSNNLRARLERVVSFPDDHIGGSHESGIKPLRLFFGPTEWEHIEAFNNRLMDDPVFRQRALREGWVKKATPDNFGVVPSYIAPIILVTGGTVDPYLVVTQRFGAERIRYAPNTWSISLEENMQGPRWVTRHGQQYWQPGDQSLHRCALRGLEEEFGVDGVDLDHLLMLGLFVEAPTAAMTAIFWAHLKISWQQFTARLPDATDPEARIIAREPVTTRNLVHLFLSETYEPRRNQDRDFVAPGGAVVSPGQWHPGSRPRLLAYLLTDTKRHPLLQLIRAFHEAGLETDS